MTTQRGVWRKSQVGCGDLLSIRKPSTVILVSPAWIYFICPHPSLPQIHTTPWCGTTAFSKHAIHIDTFLGGGSSVSLRIASFYEQEGIPEISFHFSRPAPASQTAGYSRCSVRGCLSWWISPPRWFGGVRGRWSLSFTSRLQRWSGSRLIT